MYRSAVGLFITNLFMVWLILLNNEGPGWEVPVDTMMRIDQVMVVIVIGLVVSVGLMLWDVARHRLHLSVFTCGYFVYLLLSIGFFVFLFRVDAPSGQYWHENFPMMLFGVVAIGVDVLMLAAVSVARFRRAAPGSSPGDAGS